MRTILTTIFLSLVITRPLSALAESGHHHHLPEGGRRALHGMVLVGAGPYFLEHIPMLSPPHDYQIIAEVKLLGPNGAEVTADFSRAGFTLKPAENFSLNDYISGRLREFRGSIHRGSFELGGPTLPGLGEVTIQVTDYKLIRQLPADSDAPAFFFNDGKSEFSSNLIRPGENVQSIRNLTTGERIWCVRGPDFFDPC